MYYISTQIQSKTKTAVMRLSPELKERYETLARHTDRPASYYMRLAMEEKIAEYEHIYLMKQEVEDYRAGKVAAVSFDDLMGQLLDD